MKPAKSFARFVPRAPIWDLPIRLFHWLLIALLAFSWWSAEQHAMDWHRRSGLAIVMLLSFRLYWGSFGSMTARFANFVRAPRAVFGYVRALSSGRYQAKPGHNPLGGWSVVLMLATLVLMAGAGLFAIDIDGLESGPLADFISFDQGRFAAELHHIIFKILLAVAALHIVAIFFYLIRLRQNLITPMIIATAPASGETSRASWASALIGIALAGGLTYAIANSFHF